MARGPASSTAAVAAVTAGLCLGLAAPGTGQEAAERDLRVEGEYGLHVRELPADGHGSSASAPGSVEVVWLNRGTDQGLLRVFVGDSVVHQDTTLAGLVHRATFPDIFPRPLTLEYGSASDPDGRFRTTLRPPPGRAEGVVTGADSLFVVGDVHGEYDNLVALLGNAGLIDDELRWTGGRSHLVLLGDLLDRGPNVTRVLWLLYRLETEAEAAGGRVHIVLGNHELLVISGDLRYVHPKEQLLADYTGIAYDELFDPDHTVLGRWLASKPGLMKIDDVLLAHGGVVGHWSDVPVPAFNDTLAIYLDEENFDHEHFFWSDESVFWHREYVLSHSMRSELHRALKGHDAELHVIANTTVPSIEERYDGKLIAVDLENPATEMLMLTGEPGARKRYRYTMEGPPEPLGG
ncbi:MAG: metallophosphoesterase [Gemmatimonadota bacterium]|nr:metallophosphoesterase [Gemmatimonadota bacterium]